jgi:hypothetical protein
MHNSTPSHFPLDAEHSGTILIHDSAVGLWLRRAQQVIANEGLSELEERRLLLIVEAALQVLSLHFAAALRDPTAKDLYIYFEEFIVRSVGGRGAEEPENVQ